MKTEIAIRTAIVRLLPIDPDKPCNLRASCRLDDRLVFWIEYAGSTAVLFVLRTTVDFEPLNHPH